MLLTTLTTRADSTIYVITDAHNMTATVAKWQPSAEDEIVSFDVPVYDLGPIDQIDDLTGELVGEYSPYAPKNVRAFDPEQQDHDDNLYPGVN